MSNPNQEPHLSPALRLFRAQESVGKLLAIQSASASTLFLGIGEMTGMVGVTQAGFTALGATIASTVELLDCMTAGDRMERKHMDNVLTDSYKCFYMT